MSERYARQTALPEIGAAGQERLAAATVVVVGAGGLGCPVLQYLAAAGVGRLVIVDHDQVQEANLHRQPLYRMSDLGLPKVTAARAALLALNPQVRVDAQRERLGPGNAEGLVSGAQLVIDAADSFAATYVLSDTCRDRGLPLVSASVLGLAGYVGVFCGGAPSYRAVFPEMPRTAAACAEAGVLGSAVGVIGTLEAHLALALLLGLSPSPLGRLMTIDFRTLHVGGFFFTAAAEPQASIPFIAPAEVSAADLVIDLRSAEEAPLSPFPGARRLAVEALEQAELRLAPQARIVLCCRSGLRAWRAARALQSQGHASLALIALGE